MKKLVTALVIVALIGTMFLGCTSTSEKKKLTIAYQYGMAYAPLIIMQNQKLIEKHFGDSIEVEWKIMTSGTVINEGVVSGDIDVAYMGIAPFISGVSNGISYKLYSALSAQPMGLNTKEERLRKLSDFTQDDKIALVSYGSIQHIMLAMAAEKELGNPAALDTLILNMAHPDGMQALLSGSVTAHLTTSPYYNKELEDSTIHEITEVSEAFPKDCTIIIGAATTKLYDDKKLYNALVIATDEAIEYTNANIPEVAKLLYENEGVSAEVMEGYLNNPKVKYTKKPSGVIEIAEFMSRAGLVKKAITDNSELFFDADKSNWGK